MKTLTTIGSSLIFVGMATVCLGQTNTFPSSGNAGVETTTPADLLHLNIGAARKGITVSSDGNLAAYSDVKFAVSNPTGIVSGTPDRWYISHRKDGYYDILVSNKAATAANVLIGKTTQQNTSYRLDVNGKIRSNEIVVNTSGADFVFDPQYNLPSLEDVEAYIKANKHLQDIPPAAEMQRDGMNVGELNTKMLQKIEELTLYIIDQQKRINELETQMRHIQHTKGNKKKI